MMKHAKKIIEKSKDLFEQIQADNVGVFAAQSAFFFMLSVFPFIMMLLTAIKYLPVEQYELIRMLHNFLPERISSYFSFMTDEIYDTTLGFGALVSFVIMIWSASKGTMSIGTCLTYMDEVQDEKNYFLRRAIHALYTIIFCVMLVAVMLIYVLGDFIMEKFIVGSIIENIASLIFTIVRLALGPAFVFGVILLAYCRLPVLKGRVKRNVPGAIFTTVGWLLVSIGFSMYVRLVGVNTYMYGSLAGIIIVILWLYFCMYILFLGAELNKIIENGLLTQK